MSLRIYLSGYRTTVPVHGRRTVHEHLLCYSVGSYSVPPKCSGRETGELPEQFTSLRLFYSIWEGCTPISAQIFPCRDLSKDLQF